MHFNKITIGISIGHDWVEELAYGQMPKQNELEASLLNNSPMNQTGCCKM